LHGQCSTQIPPNCVCADGDKILYIDICHAGVTYQADITVCTQYATTAPIDNPCTPDCVAGLNSITWVKKICVPPDLKNLGLLAIYQAIIRGTNLCCAKGNFLNVTLPNCTYGTNCITSADAYCHILALPRCLKKNYVTGCYEQCNGCNDYCLVERRYCMTTPTTCCKQMRTICSYNDDDVCNQECNTTGPICKDLDDSDVCCD